MGLWQRPVPIFRWFSKRIDTKKKDETSSSASARSVLQRAVADAEQIVASVKERAKAEAEDGRSKK